MSNAQPTWLEQVDRLRAHLDAMRHHYTDLCQRADNGDANAARFIPETEADIKNTLCRLSDLGAI